MPSCRLELPSRQLQVARLHLRWVLTVRRLLLLLRSIRQRLLCLLCLLLLLRRLRRPTQLHSSPRGRVYLRSRYG